MIETGITEGTGRRTYENNGSRVADFKEDTVEDRRRERSRETTGGVGLTLRCLEEKVKPSITITIGL